MTASAWSLTDTARTKIWNGQFNSGDSYKCALFASTTNLGAASTTYAALTNELATANGYTLGGVAVSFTLTGTTSVNVKFAVDPQWIITGSSIAFRKIGLYEVGGDVLAWCLADATNIDYTVPAGSMFAVVGNPAFQTT